MILNNNISIKILSKRFELLTYSLRGYSSTNWANLVSIADPGVEPGFTAYETGQHHALSALYNINY